MITGPLLVANVLLVGGPSDLIRTLAVTEDLELMVERLKGSYRSSAITSALVATAAAALSAVTEHEASRVVLLASMAFSLSCIASSTFHLSDSSLPAERILEIWIEETPGEIAPIIISLSMPAAWLFYAITTFKVALLIEAWRGHVLAVKIVLTILIGIIYLTTYWVAFAVHRGTRPLRERWERDREERKRKRKQRERDQWEHGGIQLHPVEMSGIEMT